MRVSVDGQFWEELDFNWLAEKLHDEAPDLVTDYGMITSLGYNNELDRYSIVVLYENEEYAEVNCALDFAGANPFPFNIHQYKVFVPHGNYIGGYSKDEKLFIKA